MLELLERLCRADAPSGAEENVRRIIVSEIEGHCDYEIDRLGNIIARKTGKKRAARRVMLDAHIDEVGVIVTSVTGEGFLKFATVGGIEPESLAGKRVRFVNGVRGVIGVKPIHLCSEDERKTPCNKDSLLIDVGAENADEAKKLIAPGTLGTFDADFTVAGGRIVSKALDDRIGCAVLIKLLQEESEYDFTATFTVREEVGLIGASAAVFGADPELAVVVEATTAGDIGGVPEENKVCRLGGGAVLSFMDRATLYDRGFFRAALKIAEENGIPCQIKQAVAGGNNAGTIHKSLAGVRTLAVSSPCRYIHSPSSVVSVKDVDAVLRLARATVESAAAGRID